MYRYSSCHDSAMSLFFHTPVQKSPSASLATGGLKNQIQSLWFYCSAGASHSSLYLSETLKKRNAKIKVSKESGWWWFVMLCVDKKKIIIKKEHCCLLLRMSVTVFRTFSFGLFCSKTCKIISLLPSDKFKVHSCWPCVAHFEQVGKEMHSDNTPL